MIFLQEKRRDDGIQSEYEVISNYFEAVLVLMFTLMKKIFSKPSEPSFKSFYFAIQTFLPPHQSTNKKCIINNHDTIEMAKIHS